MNRIYKSFRYLIYTLEIYILYSLQQTSIFRFSFLGTAPILTLSGFICISLFENEFISLFIGILSGLLIDLSFGNFLGANALALGLVGYALGILFYYYIKANFLSAMFFSSLTSLIVGFSNLYVYQSVEGFSFMKLVNNYKWYCLGICAALVSLPIYLINRAISYLMRER